MSCGRKFLTPEIDAIIRERFYAGDAHKDIAAAAGFSQEAVRKRIRAMGLQRAPRGRPDGWTPEQLAALEIGFEQDLPISEIAEMVGRTPTSVRDKLVYLRAAKRMTDALNRPAPHVPYVPQEFTARFCGDPSPERSALGREIQSHEYASTGRQGRYQTFGDGMGGIGA